jgi:hypothetical protein
MSAPHRIQLKRTKGWRKPEGAVVVARPSKWGNPFKVGDPVAGKGVAAITVQDRAHVVELYGRWILGQKWLLDSITELQGHDLACWCPLDQPCHADVLLKLANH